MKRIKQKNHSLGFRSIIAFALVICSAVLLLVGSSSALGMQEENLTTGQQNIVKRAYQMTNIPWTPQKDIVGWNSEITYRAGTLYTGLPYGQPVYASYVPWSTNLVDFVGMVNDPNSKMYTSYSGYEARAPYYSTDCSAFISWAWGLPSRQTTSTIKNFATQISTTSYANAQVGDCLCLAGSHVVLITDITYDESGTINSIEISEATVSSLNCCCHSVRYGIGGKYSLEYLTSKYFGNGYILYRSKTRDNVTYNHSCAIPLEGDICSDCGLGQFAETPTDLTVISTEDVILYTLPNTNADQLGTVYAGNEITVKAYCEDDSGILWYKTADNEWILASGTKLICIHDYISKITAAPSCLDDGLITYTCSLCDDSYTQVLEATGHDYKTAVFPPGCETGGYTEHCCAVCGDTYRDAEIPAIGHNYENGVCTACEAKDASVRKGDLNNDGEITAADSVLLVRYLAGLQDLNETQLQTADINGDNEVTSADAVMLVRYLAGLIEIH